MIRVANSGFLEEAASSIRARTRSGGGTIIGFVGTRGGVAFLATLRGTLPHFSACLRAAEMTRW